MIWERGKPPPDVRKIFEGGRQKGVGSEAIGEHMQVGKRKQKRGLGKKDRSGSQDVFNKGEKKRGERVHHKTEVQGKSPTQT